MDFIFNSVSFGFLFHKNSYLRISYWNVLDCVLAITSLYYSLVPSSIVLKCFSALRFLKLLEYFRNTRNVSTSVANSLGDMSAVVVFSIVTLLAFSVISVNFFQGELARCYSLNSEPINVGISNCTNSGGVWSNPIDMGNFDNIFSSSLFLFELMTGLYLILLIFYL